MHAAHAFSHLVLQAFPGLLVTSSMPLAAQTEDRDHGRALSAWLSTKATLVHGRHTGLAWEELLDGLAYELHAQEPRSWLPRRLDTDQYPQ